jgi:hypothetical protein
VILIVTPTLLVVLESGTWAPETRCARSGDVSIAYQVPGEGPFDVVIAPGAVSHVEFQWEAAGQTASLRGVARSCADDPY